MAHLFLYLQTTLHGRIKAVANISHWQGGHLESDRDSTSFSLGRDETSVCVRPGTSDLCKVKSVRSVLCLGAVSAPQPWQVMYLAPIF